MTKKSNKKIKACLIGCGRIGFGYDKGVNKKIHRTHFSALYYSKLFNLCSVAELDENIRNLIEKKYHIKTYTNHKELFKNEKCDLIVIATSDKNHERILYEAIKNKPKMIFCEKPLSLKPENIEKIIKTCQDKIIKLQINYSRRFIKEYQEIKKIIDNNIIGRIEHFNIFYSRGLIHNGSHYADLINWFFGQPDKIIKESVRPGLSKNDNTVNCALLYKNGLEVRLTGIDTSNLIINEIDMLGTKGRININTDGIMKIDKLIQNKSYKGFNFYGLAKEKTIANIEAVNNAYNNIYNHLCANEKLISPGNNDLNNSKLLIKILNS